MLPSLSLLTQIPQRILNIPNQRKESKRREHYCLFLLGYEAGLRISEAINFNLSAKTKKGLYQITKTKGRKERYVYIPKQVIKELKKHDWKPKSTNRFNFYHFLRKIKRELNLPTNIELTPHTLRRAFATYHAESGLSLPLLSKLLGHKSVRTTSLYWMNIYNDDGDGFADILTGKFWLERPKKPPFEPEVPLNLNLEKLPELLTPNLLASELPPNYLSKVHQLEKQLSQIRTKNNHLKTELARKKEQNANLRQDLRNSEEQNTTLRQKKQQIQQNLTNEQNQRIDAESNLAQERQINRHFRQQLQIERKTNANLTQKIHAYEQNYSNLINAYQNALKDKQAAELLIAKEKQRADYYERQLKSIAKTLYQWQKSNCQQQEKEQNELKAQIIQPPLWKESK